MMRREGGASMRRKTLAALDPWFLSHSATYPVRLASKQV